MSNILEILAINITWVFLNIILIRKEKDKTQGQRHSHVVNWYDLAINRSIGWSISILQISIILIYALVKYYK